jgi:hypothetical protein
LQSEISNTEKKMKNAKLGLCILALTCVICLFVPCSALAQEGSDDPCCYNAPSGTNPFGDGAIQLLNSADAGVAIHARQAENPAKMPMPAQLSSDMAIAIPSKAAEMPVITESRKLSYMRQS